MTVIGWPVLEFVSRLLEPQEREAVCGDLAETGEGGLRGLFEVAGLVVRRQALLWNSWRPWLAAFGIAVPGSFLLMGFSLAVSRSVQWFLDPQTAAAIDSGPHLALTICQVLLLVGWSTTAGLVVGMVSRRTLWVSALASLSPSLFCLARFRQPSLSRLCLLLFALPAIWGVRQGLLGRRPKPGFALPVAVVLTALTALTPHSTGPWFLNFGLNWPAWYLVASAYRSDANRQNT